MRRQEGRKKLRILYLASPFDCPFAALRDWAIFSSRSDSTAGRFPFEDRERESDQPVVYVYTRCELFFSSRKGRGIYILLLRLLLLVSAGAAVM